MAAVVKTTSRLVPAKQAARDLGLPYTSLRYRVFCGELSVVKMDRAWYFKPKDLDAFIERNTERISVAG